MGERFSLIWSVLTASVAGSSHRTAGRGCDDAFRTLATHDLTVSALSDGAGSARLSRVGAQIAVQAATSHAAEAIRGGLHARDALWESLNFARSMVERGAVSLGPTVTPSDLSCTLLVAALGSFGLATAQIGDGAIVVGFDDAQSLTNLTPPGTAEYHNVTDFLTSSSFREATHINYLDEHPNRLALMSDGVEHLAINGASHQPERGFFHPLFQRLQRDELERSQLEKLFRSSRVTARSDDDMTLTLVCRQPQSYEPGSR